MLWFNDRKTKKGEAPKEPKPEVFYTYKLATKCDTGDGSIYQKLISLFENHECVDTRCMGLQLGWGSAVRRKYTFPVIEPSIAILVEERYGMGCNSAFDVDIRDMDDNHLCVISLKRIYSTDSNEDPLYLAIKTRREKTAAAKKAMEELKAHQLLDGILQ